MNNKNAEILEQAKNLIKDEMSELSYKTWIFPLEISDIQENNIFLIVSDSFKKDSIEARFKDLIENAFSMVLQKKCNISLILPNEEIKKSSTNNNSFSSIKSFSNSFLNPNYTFDNFVVATYEISGYFLVIYIEMSKPLIDVFDFEKFNDKIELILIELKSKIDRLLSDKDDDI